MDSTLKARSPHLDLAADVARVAVESRPAAETTRVEKSAVAKAASKDQLGAVRANHSKEGHRKAIELQVQPVVREPSAELARGKWSGKCDFLFTLLSYAVGLGNVWRFPYLCYKNGGGAFLIPFILMLVLAGMPLFFLEVALGQYAGVGLADTWKISPIFKGMGYGMFFVSFLVGIYYNMLIAYSFYYLFASLASDVPWKHCGNSWNTPACSTPSEYKNCLSDGGVWYNKTCWTESNHSIDVFAQFQALANITGRHSASYEYFNYEVLGISSNLDDPGSIRWQLLLCLLLSWFVVMLCLIKGIQSTGKAVYFTALFPYVVLIILLCRAVTLDGALEGITYYVTPKWSLLKQASVWGDAAVQIFFSLSPGWGGMITMASYNAFDNNCLRDSIFVPVAVVLTSLFSGLVIFSIIGFMAHQLNLTIDEVADKGAGLAFIAYPEVVAQLPVAPLWSVLFFMMLLTLGIGTQFTIVTTVHSFILDLFPNTLRAGWRSAGVTIAISITSFILGIPLCLQSGMYLLQMMDAYAAAYSTLILGLLECIIVCWIYGMPRFASNIKEMLSKEPSVYWKICWKYVCPVTVLFILLFTFADLHALEYRGVRMPWWADVLGWLMTFACVAPVPSVAVAMVIKHRKGTIKETIVLLSLPTSDWGPSSGQKRVQRRNSSPLKIGFDSRSPSKSGVRSCKSRQPPEAPAATDMQALPTAGAAATDSGRAAAVLADAAPAIIAKAPAADANAAAVATSPANGEMYTLAALPLKK